MAEQQKRDVTGKFVGKDQRIMNIFDKIWDDLDKKRPYPLRFKITNEISRYSYEWFLEETKKHKRYAGKNAILKDQSLTASTIKLGKLYQFKYDPKFKNELPYYDEFPLILPFNINATHIWGINFHYLPMQIRWFLFAEIWKINNDTTTSEDTKLKLNYNLLMSIKDNKLIAPMIHCYLRDPKYLKSAFVQIDPKDWKIALLLPNASFRKQSEMRVQQDSLRKIYSK